MEINEVLQNEILILELSGKIDVNSSKTFQEKYNEIVEKNTTNLILDCEKLNFVSSSGLRVFLMFLKHINKIGGKMVICNMSEIIYEVFEISGFVPIFNIKDNRDEALSEFN